jgi:hypothetical protein
MHDGTLLQSDLTGLPLIYRQSWPQARAESFTLAPAS